MDDKFLTQRIVKAFRHIPPLELPDAPVHAIKGLSEHDAELLYDSFWVKTIRDLADLKFVHWAQEICALRDVPQEKIDMYGFQDKLNKAYEQTSIRTLMKSPVHVIQGLSEGDATRLEEAFKVRSVKDLANLKFARYAQEICGEAYKDLSAPIRSDQTYQAQGIETRRWWAPLIAMILTVLALLLLAYFAPICFPGDAPPALQTSSNDQDPSDAPELNEAVSPEDGESPDTDGMEAEEDRDSGSPIVQKRNASEDQDGNQPTTDSDHRPGGSYYVQDGDTLTDISRRIYGTTTRWKEIYEANQDKIKDPDNIFPGEVLSLPPD